jgi:riboflavin kinase/FMN adenylyltransferase
VGTRPTFGEGERTVETYLLDYKGDLYGKEITIEFVRKVRDERRFPSAQQLIAQMRKDVQEVHAILTKDLK